MMLTMLDPLTSYFRGISSNLMFSSNRTFFGIVLLRSAFRNHLFALDHPLHQCLFFAPTGKWFRPKVFPEPDGWSVVERVENRNREPRLNVADHFFSNAVGFSFILLARFSRSQFCLNSKETDAVCVDEKEGETLLVCFRLIYFCLHSITIQ